MSIEWHRQAPYQEQRVRSAVCGHTLDVQLSSHAASEMITCARCGRVQPICDLQSVGRDCVPTRALGWHGMQHYKSKSLMPCKLTIVRLSSDVVSAQL